MMSDIELGLLLLSATYVFMSILGGPAAVEVRVEMWQTFETARVRSEVTVDGRSFFAREWRLDVSSTPLRTAS